MRLLLASVLACVFNYAAHAEDVLRVGYAAEIIEFVAPLLAGEDQGIFKAHGVTVQLIAFSGGARLHQGIVAGAADVALAGGTDFSYIAKGVPERVVADIAAPTNTVLTVSNPAIHSIDDLKGAKIGVTSIGAYTYWCARELARVRGWGPDGVTPVAIGGSVAVFFSALQTGQVAATMGDAAVGFALQQSGRGRILTTAAEFAPNVPGNLIFAQNDLIRDRPDTLRRFLAAWFESVTWLIDHQAGAVAIGQRVTGQSAEVMEAVFALQAGGWSRDGRLSTIQLAAISQAIVDSGLLPERVDLTTYYTDAYLPRPPSP